MEVPATEVAAPTGSPEAMEWPKTLARQAQAVQRVSAGHQHPVSADMLAGQFKKQQKQPAFHASSK